MPTPPHREREGLSGVLLLLHVGCRHTSRWILSIARRPDVAKLDRLFGWKPQLAFGFTAATVRTMEELRAGRTGESLEDIFLELTGGAEEAEIAAALS